MKKWLQSHIDVGIFDELSSRLFLALLVFTLVAAFQHNVILDPVRLLLFGELPTNVFGLWLCLVCVFGGGWFASHASGEYQRHSGRMFSIQGTDWPPALVVLLVAGISLVVNVNRHTPTSELRYTLAPAMLSGGFAMLCIYRPWATERLKKESLRHFDEMHAPIERYCIERSMDKKTWTAHPTLNPPAGYFDDLGAASDVAWQWRGSRDGEYLRVMVERCHVHVVIGPDRSICRP